MRKEDQPARKSRSVWTLPAPMMLRENERAAVSAHIMALRPLITMTPAADERYDTEATAALTRMLLTLPAQRTTEIGAQAAGESFMDALEDVPAWATKEAIRLWYRGEHEQDPHNPFDFRWRPSPADLRKLAKRMAWRIVSRIEALERLLSAEALVEYGPERREEMKAKVVSLGLSTADPPPKREHD